MKESKDENATTTNNFPTLIRFVRIYRLGDKLNHLFELIIHKLIYV